MIKDSTQLTPEQLKEVLLNEEITIEQFFIFEWLKTDKPFLQHYLDVNKHHINIIDVVQDLIIKGYLTLIDPKQDYSLDNLSIVKNISEKEIQVELKPVENVFETYWEEFISLYPKKSGDRPLHNMKSICKDKYFKYLQQGLVHESVIKGLKLEVSLRERAKLRKQFFPEWKLLSTYINQKGWEQFVELEVDENQEYNVSPDGRITRVL